MPTIFNAITIQAVSAASGPAPLVVNVTYTTDPVTNITWDFGDGTTYVSVDGAEPISHTYTTPGSYVISAVAEYPVQGLQYDYWAVRSQGQLPLPPSDPSYATSTAPYIVPIVVSAQASLFHLLKATDHGTRVRIDSTGTAPIKVVVGDSYETWPDGCYIEVVNLSATATVELIGANVGVLTSLSGTTFIKQGEYARVSQVSPGSPGPWDMHVYRLPVETARPLGEVVVGAGTSVTSSPSLRFDSATSSLHVNTDASAETSAHPVWIQTGGNGIVEKSARLYMGPPADPSTGMPVLPNDPLPAYGASHITMFAGDGYDGEDGASIQLNPGTGHSSNSGSVVVNTVASNTSPNSGFVVSHQAGEGGYGLYFNAFGALGFGQNLSQHANTSMIATGFMNADYGVEGQLLRTSGSSGPIAWMDPSGVEPGPMSVIGFSTSQNIGSAWFHNKHIRMTAATEVTLTVVSDFDLPDGGMYWQSLATTSPMATGCTILIGKHGAGDVLFVAAPGVTINTPDSLRISKLNGKATLMKVGPNEWDLEGNLASA